MIAAVFLAASFGFVQAQDPQQPFSNNLRPTQEEGTFLVPGEDIKRHFAEAPKRAIRPEDMQGDWRLVLHEQKDDFLYKPETYKEAGLKIRLKNGRCEKVNSDGSVETCTIGPGNQWNYVGPTTADNRGNEYGLPPLYSTPIRQCHLLDQNYLLCEYKLRTSYRDSSTLLDWGTYGYVRMPGPIQDDEKKKDEKSGKERFNRRDFQGRWKETGARRGSVPLNIQVKMDRGCEIEEMHNFPCTVSESNELIFNLKEVPLSLVEDLTVYSPQYKCRFMDINSLNCELTWHLLSCHGVKNHCGEYPSTITTSLSLNRTK